MADSKEKLTCPACQKAMKKIPVPNQSFNLDICADGCGGIWFDNRELKYFDETTEDVSAIKMALENKTFQKVDAQNTRICPVCKVKMVKNNTGATQKVQIDACYTCGGKFFDYEEILLMREEYKTETERINATIELFEQLHSNELREHEENMEFVHPSEGKKLFDSKAKDLINFVLYNM